MPTTLQLTQPLRFLLFLCKFSSLCAKLHPKIDSTPSPLPLLVLSLARQPIQSKQEPPVGPKINPTDPKKKKGLSGLKVFSGNTLKFMLIFRKSVEKI
jgi:hypothetical protein